MNKLSPCDMAWFIGNSLLGATSLVESRLTGDERNFGPNRSRLICLLEELATMAEELGNELSASEGARHD